MKTGSMRWFGIWGVSACLTVACSDGSNAKKAAIASPVATVSAYEVASSMPVLRARLDAAAAIEEHEDAFTLAAVASTPDHAAPALLVAVPRRLSNAIRMSREGGSPAWVEVHPLGLRESVEGAVEKGAIVYRDADKDTDLVLSLGATRFEELRVLRSTSASTTSRYALSVAPGLQLRSRSGRIEVVDAGERVVFQTNAAFAVDSVGTMRSVELRLEGTELSSSFDATGLKYPIVVDPEWVMGPSWPAQAVVAQNSFELQSGGGIVGDAVVIQRSTASFLGSQAPGQVDSGAQLTGSLSADKIELQSGGVVTGDVHFNTLLGTGVVRGERFSTLTVPVPVSAPTFPTITAGTHDVTTSTSAPMQLAAGNYRNLSLVSGSVLQLTGGVYAFNSIAFGSSSRLECLAACDVGLLGRFLEATGSFFGPAASATIGADQVEVFVAATNGTSSLTAQPAVSFASGITIRGRFFAENGTISVGNGVQVVGTLVARDVLVSSGAQIVKDVPTTVTCTANDSNPCTQDSCNAAGQPVFTPLPAGTSCADANVCNGAEMCNGVGVCAPGTPLAVDDGNPCTTDACDPTTGVSHKPSAVGTSCSDGNVCNGAETCNATASCVAGTPLVVDDGNPCTVDACSASTGVTHVPAAAGTGCSDGNACNGAEACNGSGACTAGTPPVLDDGNPCTKDTCDPVLGVAHAPVDSGTSCSDGNSCNGVEICSASGACAAGTPLVLDDGNPCTADVCDPVLGVTHLPVANGTSCGDGNACNGNELCQSGLCASGTPPTVDDGNPCTADACDPVAGVTHTPVADGTSCSDGNACNGNELCARGTCAPGSAPTVDDGNPCTADSCDAKTGVHHVPVATGTSCSDGNACNGAETCSATGACVASAPPVVDDGNPCTADACDPASGVTHSPVTAGTACDDGDVCNGHETCNAIGFCAAGTPLVVDDGNPCTADTCDKQQGVKHTPVAAGTSCADSNVCNGSETCDSTGTCAPGTPLVLDDGNPCTADSCDPTAGVKHVALANGSACDDATVCNGHESCQQGSCAPGTAPVLDDNNPCTADSCDPVSGVSHTPSPSGSSCADANLCNGSELCDGAGHCQAGTPLVTDDGNPCTADSCSPSTGVVHTPVAAGTSCSDSNVCNGSEQCDSTGSCAPGAPLTIDDGNPCTVDSCDPSSGVQHLPAQDGTSCDDGNACNGSESCQKGACAAGTAPVLDDGNPCTVDSCDPTAGVVHTPVPSGTSCSDGNACNGTETCNAGGACAAGVAPSVDDGNPCTSDACDPVAGITHTPVAAGLSCSDNNVCNGQERCDALGTCMAGSPLAVDDGDVCTTDSCDPIAGVTHTPISGCAGAVPGQQFETRASIMGRVIDGSGAAVTAFTIEVFNDRLDSPARTDVSTTINADGTFRTRLSSFPQSAVDRTPPQHVLVRVEGDAFPTLLRSAYLRPGEVAALGDLMILQRDPNVTVIGPEGGVAEDSQGTLQLTIPPGALSQPTPVQLTPVPTREQFTTPLPNSTVTMYGMEIEPSGTELSLPATLKVKNTLNLPTGMNIPVGTVDARYGDWTHEGFAVWDGSRFTTTISHFSPHDANDASLGELVTIVSDGDDRNKNKSKDRCVGSSVDDANGSLGQSFDVPLHSAAGHDYSLSLNYSSELSGSVTVGQGPDASIPIAKQSLLRSFMGPNVRLACSPPSGGVSCSGSGSSGAPPCFAGVGSTLVVAAYGLTQRVQLFNQDVLQTQNQLANAQSFNAQVYLPIPDDDQGNPVRSGYMPIHFTSNVAVSGAGTCVGGGAGFGVAANFNNSVPLRLPIQTGDLLDFPTYQLVAHRRGSPLGSGWSFAEISTLYRTPDGVSADIIHGDGQQETFHPYPSLHQVIDFQNSSAQSLAVDTQTGDVFAAQGSLGIEQVNVTTGAVTMFASGSLFGGRTPIDFKVTYVNGLRHFLAATVSGWFDVGPDGTSRQIGSFQDGASRDPSTAGLGKYAYLTLDKKTVSSAVVDAITILRLDLTNPTATAVDVTPNTNGDLRLDPHGETQAQGFQFLHPAGLAGAFDGGLYVADDRRHAVYHLAPDDAGEVGPDSVVTRVLGSGVDSMGGGIGQKLPALEIGIRQPSRLTVAPDGILYVLGSADIGGLLSFDPVEQTARWVAFDKTAQLGTTDPTSTLTQVTFRGGSLAPLAGAAGVLLPFDGLVYDLTTALTSQYEPLRALSFSDTGATVVDASADEVELYTWSDADKGEAQLVGETRRSGEPIRTIAYKDMDRVDYIQDPVGGRVAFAYDGAGHLSSVTDPAQRSTRFNVDSDGNLREVIYPSGEARRFDYDADFRMTSSTHPDGEVSIYTYAADGTLQTAQRPGGGITSVQSGYSRGPQYDADGLLFYESLITDDRGVQHALTTNAAGAVVSDKYAADGNSYDVENVYAAVLKGSAAFDSTTNRLLRFSNQTINGLAVGPATTFDTLGRATTTTLSPTNGTFRFGSTYDANERLSTLQFGATTVDWAYTYDAAGHLSKVADQFTGGTETGRRTTFGGFRAQDGQPTAVTSHSIGTALGYDQFGLVNSAVDSLGRSTTVVHDAAGNPTSVNDGATTIAYGYDPNGRVTSISDAEGNTTTLSYETAGCSCSNGDRVTSLVTPDLLQGQAWSFNYDADGDLQASITPLGEQETYTHDPQRDIVGIVDRAGRSTALTYDQLGRRSTVTDPVGRFGAFSYSLPTAASWSGPSLYAQSPNNAPAPTTLEAALADGQYQIGTNGFQPGADASHVALYRDATFQISQWVTADVLDRTTNRADRSAGGLAFDSTVPGKGQLTGNPPFVDELYNYSATGSPAPIVFLSETNDAYQTNHFWGGTLSRNADFDITAIGVFLGLGEQFYTNDLAVSRDAAGRLTGTSNPNTPSGSAIAYLPNGRVSSVGLVTPMLKSAFTGTQCDVDAECLQTLSCFGAVPAQNGNLAVHGKCEVFSVAQQSEGEGFVYDDRGLVKQRSLGFSNGAPGGNFTYSYDAVGRNTRLIYPDGHERDQAFDALGRLSSRCYLYTDGTPAHCYNATYDAVGNPKILTDPDMREEIEYDDLDRVTEVRRYLPANATAPSYTETYAYNALGGFSIYDGVTMDDQRPRLDGNGKSSAGVPATFRSTAVVMDVGGRITSFNNQTFQYFNQHHRLESLIIGGQTQNYSYDALERIIGIHSSVPGGDPFASDENYIYSDLSSSITAVVATNFNSIVPREDPPLPNTSTYAGYDGVDHPLWYTSGSELIYPEVDTIGNVRRLHLAPDPVHPTTITEVGTFSYSAFGKNVSADDPQGLTAVGTQRFAWQGKHMIASNLYDSRARVWSADLGVFLQPDEYGFVTPRGTLWSWPGQNPFRNRDPSGRDAALWFLAHTGWIKEAAPALAAAGAESGVPALSQVGDAALLALNVIDQVASLDAQRQSAAAIVKATSNDESECKAQSQTPGGLGLSDKINKQMPARGWTPEQIDEAVQSGDQVPATNKANGNPATRYVHPDTGQSVVVDDVTGDVIQVGGPDFTFGPGSGDLPQ